MIEGEKMDLKINYEKKEAERYSKLVVSYLLLLLGIIFFIGLLNITSISFYGDFIGPIVNWIALSPLWYTIAVAAQAIIENFWPLLLVYYGAHWVLKFEKKPAKG